MALDKSDKEISYDSLRRPAKYIFTPKSGVSESKKLYSSMTYLGDTVTTADGKSESIRTYEYNDYGEVTKAVESYGNGQKNTYTYTYDAGGNILTETVNGTKHTYQYDSVWKDKLISYDGKTIKPLNYMGATCKWDVYGNLVSYSKGNDKITYTYTSDGRRRSKTVNGVTTTYRYHNGLLLSETTGDEILRYYYDNAGAVLSIGYIKGSAAENKYFFTRNAQNDIVSIYRSSDSKLIGTYEYDLWGKSVSIKEATTGIDTDGILEKNPLRYRSYRYDAETGFYHLQSRYYDPNIRRFISADTVEAVKVDVLSTNGNNLFAYCENSPVCFEDSNGQYVETPYDTVTLEMSLMEAAVPDAGFWEWVNVALDAADIAIPLATFPVGAGEICRFIRYACKSPAGKLVTASVGYADEVGDVARHTYRHIDNVGDIARNGIKRGSDLLPDIKFKMSKLQHEYKHAGDFGIEGNWNKVNGNKFQQAIQNHIDNASEIYKSTYRGSDVYVYYDPNTGLGSYVDLDGNFVSGWKLSKEQIEFHTTNGVRIK